MKQRLVPKLRGPYFDFLVVAPDEYWELKHPKRRTRCIKQEYFHHPDALRVSDCVIDSVVACFVRSHPRFNRFGNTEYGGEALHLLIAELNAQIAAIYACKWKREFGALVSPLFTADCMDCIGRWQGHWPRIRDEVAETIGSIVENAEAAKRSDKVLLVLGI